MRKELYGKNLGCTARDNSPIPLPKSKPQMLNDCSEIHSKPPVIFSPPGTLLRNSTEPQKVCQYLNKLPYLNHSSGLRVTGNSPVNTPGFCSWLPVPQQALNCIILYQNTPIPSHPSPPTSATAKAISGDIT
jgi:hypothetical protein